MTIEFQAFPKIPRLRRRMVVTEKIDGTNAAIGVTEDGEVYAQSRSRIITPEQDNFGFAAWVKAHEYYLPTALGPGLHFGEWWGPGIQRGYAVDSKRFSLFNTARWDDLREPLADYDIGVVPLLYEGPFDVGVIDSIIEGLRQNGSVAAPGFPRAEGVVVFLPAASQMFKVTLEKDEAPKALVAA